MIESKHKLTYGNYKRTEIAIIERIFERHSVEFVIREKRTNRNLPYFYIDAMVTKDEELLVRHEVRLATARLYNWGKITYPALTESM